MSKVVDWKNVGLAGLAGLAAITIGGAASSIARGNSPKVTELGITGAQALVDTALPKGVGKESLTQDELFSFKVPADANVTLTGPLVTNEQWTTAGNVVTPDDNLPADFNGDEIITTVPDGCRAGHLYTIQYNNNGKKCALTLVIPDYIASKPVPVSPGDMVVGSAQPYSDMRVRLADSYRRVDYDKGTDNEPGGNVIEVSDVRRAKK